MINVLFAAGPHRWAEYDVPLRTAFAEAGLAGRPVAVEVDGQVIPRGRFDEPLLRGGERIEIVTFVGGG